MSAIDAMPERLYNKLVADDPSWETELNFKKLYELIAHPRPMVGMYKSVEKPPIKFKKKYFHTFMYEKDTIKREITLCIASTTYKTYVGYSVKMPEDPKQFQADLAKNISEGRARKTPLDCFVMPEPYSYDRGVLKAIAKVWERQLKEDVNKHIKGIR